MEKQYLALTANDRVELTSKYGSTSRKFVIKRSSQYPFWTLQPEFSE